jgi:hypothetical protein
MALYPGALIPWIEQRFLDADGAPLIGGKVWTYAAGTSTPLATYTDVDLDPGSAHTNPIILDGEARPEDGPIFLAATGYKFVVMDADDVTQYTVDMIENVGQVFAGTFGNILAEGSKNVTSGYQVLTTDRLVTVDSTGGADPCVITLPAAADATQPVCIKNLGSVVLAVTPSGTDTIDTQLGEYEVPVAANPVAPCIWLAPDGVSGWFILGSHGL